MKRVNNKIVAQQYFHYVNSNTRYLEQCYGRYSGAKAKAYDYCVDLYSKYEGVDFKIIGYNTCTFSVGFVGWINDRMAFFYITANYDRYMYMDDIQKYI